jgi:hypothetical protein
MKKADKTIIADNPGATPAQLLAKGLSEGGYEEHVEALKQQGNNAQSFKIPPPPQLPPQNKPVLIPANVIQPQIPILSTVQHPSAPRNGKVRVIPPGGGVGAEMSVKAAESLKKRNPNYKILY